MKLLIALAFCVAALPAAGDQETSALDNQIKKDMAELKGKWGQSRSAQDAMFARQEAMWRLDQLLKPLIAKADEVAAQVEKEGKDLNAAQGASDSSEGAAEKCGLVKLDVNEFAKVFPTLLRALKATPPEFGKVKAFHVDAACNPREDKLTIRDNIDFDKQEIGQQRRILTGGLVMCYGQAQGQDVVKNSGQYDGCAQALYNELYKSQ